MFVVCELCLAMAHDYLVIDFGIRIRDVRHYCAYSRQGIATNGRTSGW